MIGYRYVQPTELNAGDRISQPRGEAIVVRVESADTDPIFGSQVAVHIEGSDEPLILPNNMDGGVRVVVEEPDPEPHPEAVS